RLGGVPPAAGAPLPPASARPLLPARPAAQLQREVLPRLAPALHLPGAPDRLPGRRACVPARRVAPDAAHALGARSGRVTRLIALVAAGAALLAPASSARPERTALRLVTVASGLSSP